MTSGDDALRRMDALIQVGLRLAQSARSGRVALARVAEAVELEWIPRPWGEEIAADLERANTQAREPVPLRQIERILKDAWGSNAADVLDELDPDPVAVTPAFIVHRGVLDSGRPVALKVARPGLLGTVRADLALLEGLLSPLNAAFPSVDAAGSLREIRKRLLDELDLDTEATVQRRFHRALRGHPFLTVPKPEMGLCHEQVLVSDWVSGVPLRQAPDPDEACARLVLFVLGAARAGILNADPNLDDALILGDGRLAIVDVGAWREIDPERVVLGADVLDALVAGDPEAFAQALDALGWMPPNQAPEMLALLRELLDGLLEPGPIRLDHQAVLTVRDRLIERLPALAPLLHTAALPPEDLWPVRAVAQLLGTIARVGATGHWPKLAGAAMREGWTAELSAR